MRSTDKRIDVWISPAIISRNKENIVVKWIQGESLDHWILKIAGVIELLRQGFKSSEIEIEKIFVKGNTRCRADIYAEHSGNKVWIECESALGIISENNLSLALNEKLTQIRKVYDGMLTFLTRPEDWERVIYLAREREDTRHALTRLIPNNAQIWVAYFERKPRIVWGIRHENNKIVLLKGDWAVESIFRKNEYDNTQVLSV